jgi:hypothetical protein
MSHLFHDAPRRRTSPVRLITSTVLAALLTACGGGSSTALPGDPGGPGNPGNPGARAPALASLTPADGATQVALDAQVTALFDKAIDPATVGTATLGVSPLGHGMAPQPTLALQGTSTVRMTLPLPLALATAYAVEIREGLRASDGAAYGTRTTARFTTVDGEWRASNQPMPVVQSTEEAAEPQVGVDGRGGGYALFLRDAAATRRLVVNPFDGGLAQPGWRNHPGIELGVLGSASASPSFRLAVAATGRTIVAWTRDAGPNNTAQELWTLIGDTQDPANWSVPVRISQQAGSVSNVQLQMDAAGHAYLVWQQPDTTNGNRQTVLAARYDATYNTWTGPARVTGAASAQLSPALAMNASGSAVVAWSEDGSIRVARHVGSNEWSDAVTAYTPAAGASANEPKVAMNDAGEAVIAFSLYTIATQHADVLAARMRADGSLTAAGPVAPAIAASRDNHNVAIGGNGRAVVTWVQQDSFEDLHSAAMARDGTAWVRAQPVSGIVKAPVLASDASGNVFALWSQRVGAQPRRIMSARLPRDSDLWSEPVMLALTGNDANLPQIAVDRLGRALAVWQQDTISNGQRRILSNRFR